MFISLIAAVTADRGIGRGGKLLFVDRTDQKHFRTRTMGHAVVMGRTTWESIPERFRPLPGRLNIVVTGSAHYRAEGALTAGSLRESFAKASDRSARVFVCGGQQLYEEAILLADELILTEVDAVMEGADRFFPVVDRGEFVEVSRQPWVAADGTRAAFVTYRRAGEC